MKPRVKKEGPEPVDVHVGKRIKLRRQLLHISQEQLASDCGVTFQQIQKYESGHNRVSASRLYQIAGVLSVQTSFFFEDLPSTMKDDIVDIDPMLSNETLELVRHYNRLDEAARIPLMALIRAYGARPAAAA